MTNSSPIPRELARELRSNARELQDAEHCATQARHKLDRSLYIGREQGVSVGDLALAAGMSRETAYKSIRRVEADL